LTINNLRPFVFILLASRLGYFLSQKEGDSKK
jgi:hypothetical protein